MNPLGKCCLLFFISLCAALSFNAQAKTTDKDAPLHIEANQMEMREKENISVYNGNVIITKGSLKITGEKIVIKSNDGSLKSVQINGEPATFFQINDLDEAISAESYFMNYIADTGVLVLKEKAQLQKNKNNFTSEHIIYDTLKDIVKAGGTQATSGANADKSSSKPPRVKITIHPEPKPTPDKVTK